MKDFRILFHKVLSHIGVYGSEAEEILNMFFDQVYAIFVEKLLKDKLPEEVYKNRIAEYQGYIKAGKQNLLHEDLKNYLGDESGKLFALAYMNHLKTFVHGIQSQGDITKEQVKEVGELVKNFIQSQKASKAMKSQESSIDSLQALS